MGTDPIFHSQRYGKWGDSPFFLTFTAFLGGAITVLAFAPLGAYPLALVTFALLAYLWSSATPRRAFWIGFGFGAGLFGVGVSWVYVSLHRFGGMPSALAVLATALFCLFLALYPALAGWLQARI